ncbi:hypothetical protein J2S96_001037 [Arthrobacter bambusae]|nr:hypothetical protein [Arthrobacter bambusae]
MLPAKFRANGPRQGFVGVIQLYPDITASLLKCDVIFV